jgi:hypothetical protein
VRSHRGHDDNPNQHHQQRCKQPSTCDGIEDPVVNRMLAVRRVVQERSSMARLLLLALSANVNDDVTSMTFELETGLKVQGKLPIPQN